MSGGPLSRPLVLEGEESFLSIEFNVVGLDTEILPHVARSRIRAVGKDLYRRRCEHFFHRL